MLKLSIKHMPFLRKNVAKGKIVDKGSGMFTLIADGDYRQTINKAKKEMIEAFNSSTPVKPENVKPKTQPVKETPTGKSKEELISEIEEAHTKAELMKVVSDLTGSVSSRKGKRELAEIIVNHGGE